jgi:PilZ domain
MQELNPEKLLLQDDDRRRSPRFSCGGLAKILCLPSDGIYLAGKVRDLSLNGCGIETVSTLKCGARAEILVQVSNTSFRAIGQVKAVRGPGGIGMEFIQLSAGGHDMLVELLRELARQQAIATTLRAARREPGPDQWNEVRAALLKESRPMLGRIVASQASEVSPLVVDRSALIFDEESKVLPLDFFI